MREDAGVDFVGLHVGHGADGEFPRDFRGDDGFGAGRGEGAFDAVDAEGGVAPAGHEGGFLVVEDARFAAEGLVQVVHRVADVAVQALLLLRYGRDHLLQPRDLDFAVCVDERAQHAHEIGHGFLRGAAEDTAVEILSRAFDGEAVVVASAQTVGEAGFLGAQPVIVADAAGVCFFEEPTGLGLLLDEVVQSFRPIFLHSLEAHEEIDGQFDPRIFMRLDGVQPA